jgi:S-adenosylmethionine hydrolase
MPVERAVKLDLPQPHVQRNGHLKGTVVAADRFGNLITNIGWSTIRKALPGADDRSLVFTIAGRRIRGVSSNYQSAGQGGLLVIEGSFEAFEIAVCCGSAARKLGAGIGDGVTVAVEQP